MKKETTLYLGVFFACMLLVGYFMSMFLTPPANNQATEPTDSQQANIESTNPPLSKYVAIEELNGYVSGVDYISNDGVLKSEDTYDFIVDRETKQVYLYTKQYVGSIGHKYAITITPLLDTEGNPILYDGELPTHSKEMKTEEETTKETTTEN